MPQYQHRQSQTQFVRCYETEYVICKQKSMFKFEMFVAILNLSINKNKQYINGVFVDYSFGEPHFKWLIYFWRVDSVFESQGKLYFRFLFFLVQLKAIMTKNKALLTNLEIKSVECLGIVIEMSVLW